MIQRRILAGKPSVAWLSISELEAFLEGDAARARRCLDLWLASEEQRSLAALSLPKRRREWLAGRIVAKEVIRRRHGIESEDRLRRIEIVATRRGATKGKPFYRVDDALGRFDLSISHSRDCAVAAVASAPQEHIGIDVEQIEARAKSFELLALSDDERAEIAGLEGVDRALAVTQRWVVKEALSKALGVGLRLRFERVTVHLDGGGRARALGFEGHSLPASLESSLINVHLARVGQMCVASVTLHPPAGQ